MKLNKVDMTFVNGGSSLQQIRRNQKCELPNVLLKPQSLSISYHEALGAVADHEDIQKSFPSTFGRARISLNCNDTMSSSSSTTSPIRIGVVLSGGQAAGGHNVIAGVYDFIKKISSDSVLIGFLDGPHGLFTGNYCIINDAYLNNYRNSGGFDMIGSGRHKIEKLEQFQSSMAVCEQLCLTGVIIIGGDDSNTNAAVLAEYFESNNCSTKICGVPKTIDGDLKVHPYIPISFGFDTACATYRYINYYFYH
jgi:diphosphate--fructose-6-phosphate 1-phosphotransferase